MKASLVFSLPEDEAEHRLAVQAPDLLAAVNSLDRWMRNEIKNCNRPEAVRKTFERCRDKLWQLLDDYGVDLDL